MGSTLFGDFANFCASSTLPVCNLYPPVPADYPGQCTLMGLPLSGGRYLTNLGSIIIAFLAILASFGMIFRSERKQAAVGRREMQLFLLGYIIIEICEILTVGGIPYSLHAKSIISAVHIGAISATTWVLFLNAVVGFQLLDDGTFQSLGLILISALAIFVGSGYIALDTAIDITGHFNDKALPYRNIGLYVLYQLFPLLCLVLFFLLETFLVLRVLGEQRPMLYLIAALLLMAIGQIFQYEISFYICRGTNGKINGALFETLFTLLAVVTTWLFWSSITEDDWPMPAAGETYDNM